MTDLQAKTLLRLHRRLLEDAGELDALRENVEALLRGLSGRLPDHDEMRRTAAVGQLVAARLSLMTAEALLSPEIRLAGRLAPRPDVDEIDTAPF